MNVFALRSQFSFGLDAFGSSQDAEGILDSTFFAWRGQSQFVRHLDRDFLVLLISNDFLAALVIGLNFSTGAGVTFSLNWNF